MVKNLPATQGTWVQSLGREDPPEEGNGSPLQYSCLGDSMDRGAWWATVHGVAKNQTWLVTNTFTFSSERFLPWTQSEGGILVNGMCVPAEAGEPQGTGLPGVYGHVTSSDQWVVTGVPSGLEHLIACVSPSGVLSVHWGEFGSTGKMELPSGRAPE